MTKLCIQTKNEQTNQGFNLFIELLNIPFWNRTIRNIAYSKHVKKGEKKETI